MPPASDPLLTPPDGLLSAQGERSDVSALAETHTADTAPETLPEPLRDEPATSSPLPPSDVFLRNLEPTHGELELPLAPLDTPAVPDSAPRALLGAPARARRGPYWEWALLGFSGTLLLVAMVLRQRGLPVFSAGLEREAPVVVTTAPLRPQPASTAPPLVEVAPLPAPAPTVATEPPPPRNRRPKTARRRAAAKPTPVAAPSAMPQRVPARDSVRAGLAQELP